MSRRMWETVEAKAGKVRVVKTEERKEEAGKKQEKRKEKQKKEKKKPKYIN